jgi:hypothetical protein
MITIIIFILLGVFILVIDLSPYAEWYEMVLLSLPVAVISGFVGAIVMLILPADTKTITTEYEITPIKVDSSYVYTIDIDMQGKDRKVFYYRDSSGYNVKAVLASETTFVLSNTSTAKCIETSYELTKSWINWFAWDDVDAEENRAFVMYLPIKNTLNEKESLLPD